MAWWLAARQQDPLPPAGRAARDAVTAMDRWAAVSEAEVTLATVRADLEDAPGRGGLQARVALVEERIGGIVRAREGEGAPAWSEFEPIFGRLDRQLRTDDPAARETIATLDEALDGLVGP